MNFETDEYVAVPFSQADPEKLIYILDRVVAHDSFFTDYTKGCDRQCSGVCENKTAQCGPVKMAILNHFLKPDTLTWEVYTKDKLDLVGILRLEKVILGCDAVAHYFFFDGKLGSKTDLLEAWKNWALTDHESWPALHRITIEIPAYAKALARHAQRKLGFTGPYLYGDTKIAVEGVRKEVLLWRGTRHDQLILGYINGSEPS